MTAGLSSSVSTRAATVTPILDAGFSLDELLEPTPTEEYREADPEGYACESTRPNFPCFRLVAPG